MFFKPVSNIETFRLTTSFDSRDQSIAYGPGSVINGSVLLKTLQPMQAQGMQIVFQGQIIQEQQVMKELFSIKETIALNEQDTTASSDDTTTVITAGSHLYLFAIQLPLVNYPPTITESTFPGGKHIQYTLKAYLDSPEHPATLVSNETPILYLPLVAPTSETDTTDYYTMGNDTTLQIKVKLTKSSYCPGDQCTIQLITDNNTNTNINQVYVTFITSIDHQQHVLTHQAIPVSIPKQTIHHTTQLSLPIAHSCLPTYNNDIHVAHHIILGLTQPSSQRSYFSLGYHQSSSYHDIAPLQLPITITTISKPTQPMMVEQHHQPYFIPMNQQYQEQHITDNRQYSVSPSGSFYLEQDELYISEQDNHLSVPTRLATSTPLS
ncbi:hypothetical protein BC941DRAFT_503087 [Chlamydoabsidia padenii]|nr:hypothetical protein BC941DRAFT_503087 [Chlamydoabsidia padenii]